MGYGWNGTWAALASGLVDALRFLAWSAMCGLVATGAAWYGGSVAYEAWRHMCATRPSRRPGGAAREARRGIREIEEYLERRAPTPPARPHDQDARGRGRRDYDG